MKLGGRQLAVMRVLWQNGESTVAEVQELLGLDPPLAYSTVATVLSRMEKKGLVSHRAQDRQFYYSPLVTEGRAGQSIVGELVDRMFGGSPAELVNHLLSSEQVDQSELNQIKRLVEKHVSNCKEKQ